MYEWPRLIQGMVDEIDRSILAHEEETLTLQRLSRDMGYSAYHATRKFREIAGMPLRDYLRRRRLAFALKEVRDSDRALLDIAVDYGFSSHEAFTRAFKALYGVTPGAYRRDPRPVVLGTKIHPFDRYAFGMGEIGMIKSEQGVKTYFVTIPRPPVSASAELREQRLLGLLGEAEHRARRRLRHSVRAAGQHQGQAG